MPKMQPISVLFMLLAVVALIALPAVTQAQAERGFIDGVQCFQDADYERAIRTLERYVKQNPDSESAWYYLGRSYMKMPKPDLTKALEAFQHTVELNPSRPGLRLYVGEIYEMQGAYEEALQVYQEELRLRKGRNLAEIKMPIARVYYLNGDYHAALELLNAVIRLEPRNVEALYYMGLAETGLGFYDDAVKRFRTAGEICQEYQALHFRLTNAEGDETRLAELRRRNVTQEGLAQQYGNAERFVTELRLWPTLNKKLGDAFLAAGEFAEARIAYRKCLDRTEGGQPADPEPYTLIARAYLADAKDLFHNQGLLFQCIAVCSEAVDTANEAITKNEKYAPAHSALGEIYLFQAQTYMSMPEQGILSHNYEDAMIAFKKAIELDQSYTPAIYFLAQALTDTGQFREASTLLEKVVELEPKNADAHAALAKAYLGQEDAMKAAEEAQTALALDRQNYDGLVNAGLTDFYYRDKLSSAIDYFSRAIAVQPNRSEAYLAIGNAYFQMESWYRARHEYLKALALMPDAVVANTATDRAHVSYMIAYTYHHGGLYDKEIEYLNEAIALQPAYVEALRQIARAYEAKTEPRAAEVSLDAAAAAAPDDQTESAIYVQKGEMYERLGRPHDAITAYTTALDIDDENYEAQAGLKRLGASG